MLIQLFQYDQLTLQLLLQRLSQLLSLSQATHFKALRVFLTFFMITRKKV